MAIKMSTHYRRYIEDLKRRREEDPYYQRARAAGRDMSQQYEELMKQYDTRLKREGLPEISQQDFVMNKSQLWNRTLANMESKAAAREAERDEEINANIDKAQLKYDIAKEQEEEREKAEREARNKKWWQLGGTALGAAAGTVIAPGVGTQIGASLGSAAGSGVAAFTGSETDPYLFEQGMADLASGVGQFAMHREQADFMEKFKTNILPKLTNPDIDSQTLENLATILPMLPQNGNYNELYEILEQALKGANTDIIE
jgi:hypothetical protein